MKDDVSFLNTNRYPFERRVFIEGKQWLLDPDYAEGIILSEFYNTNAVEDDVDPQDVLEHIILILSGNSINLFNVTEVFISNGGEDNHHTLVFKFDECDEEDPNRTCELCIDEYITEITYTDSGLLITCFEAPVNFEFDRNPRFPVLLHYEAPSAAQQLSHNMAVKHAFAAILLNDHMPPFNFSHFTTDKKVENFEALNDFVNDLNSYTFGMGIDVGYPFMTGNHTSENYPAKWKHKPHQRVIINSIDIASNNCVVSTEINSNDESKAPGNTRIAQYLVPLNELLFDIDCLIAPEYTLVCTPTRSYIIGLNGDTDVEIEIEPSLFEISDDEEEEEKRDQFRKFIFTDYLNKQVAPGEKGMLIGLMIDKDDKLFYLQIGHAYPSDGTTPPTELRIVE